MGLFEIVLGYLVLGGMITGMFVVCVDMHRFNKQHKEWLLEQEREWQEDHAYRVARREERFARLPVLH